MSVAKLLLQAAAGNAGGASLDITDVFSTYLYTGNDSTQAINNGIDLDGEGGMVWLARRASGAGGGIYDTERGIRKYVETYGTGAQSTSGAEAGLYVFNSNGFTLGSSWNTENYSGYNYVSWTFRKAAKFFDVVTYTGNGVAGREIAHNLGSVPGCIIVKRTSGADNWTVFHRGMDSTAPEDYVAFLNTTEARSDQDLFYDTAPTDSVFYLGDNIKLNGNGSTYVAYLFAHNDGDGEFGPDGDADIIKCGSYTGNGSSNGPEIDLGFEPQWIMVKNAGNTGGWVISDVMRGFDVTDTQNLLANDTASETSAGIGHLLHQPTPTGFKLLSGSASSNQNNTKYIYMAIRRGPLAVPEDATEVFAVDAVNSSAPYFTSGFPVDMGFYKSIYGSSGYVSSRITGLTEGEIDTNAAFGSATAAGYDNMTGFLAGAPGSNYYGWMWKRAPSYFDVVAYTGTGSPNEYAPTLSHNLTVPPEMVWVKKRSAGGTALSWAVSSQVGTGGVQAYLDSNIGEVGTLATTGPSNTWSDYFTATQVIGNGGGSDHRHSAFPGNHLNVSGWKYIMYLFATAPGVSKVGSYTGNGASSQNIDCGFTSGSRLVMIKDVDHTQGWFLFDSLRGIVSGDDPYLYLNSTAGQGEQDAIDPYSGGFTVSYLVNGNGYNYIFYAIA